MHRNFPFGFGGHEEEFPEEEEVPQGEQDNKKLYEILGVDTKATQDEIKKAYKDLAKKYHPDRAEGDIEKFKEINAANEILSDPEKRQIYDKYGLEGIKNGGGFSGATDIFDLLTGMGGRGG